MRARSPWRSSACGKAARGHGLRSFTVAAAFFPLLIASAASAQGPAHNAVLPPVEFDHPFKGELTVERDKDRFPEWPGCQKVASDRTVLGCSVRTRNRDGTIDKSRCDVYVAPDYVLQRSGTN
jgi:hypothetical protein